MSAPSESTDRSAEAERLAHALEALPNDQFLALSLKYLEGWPLDLIAQTMQASDFVVAGLLRHGVCRLCQPEIPASGVETVALPTVPAESIDAALADYLRAADSGGEPDRTALLESYPDLGEFFAAADRLADLADLLRGTWSSRRTAPDADGDSLGDNAASGTPAVVQIPGYFVLGILGRGGMGIVYKAVDLQLRRTVALKMLRDGSLAGAADRARFVTEAQAIARSPHPNIVQVFEIGEHDGLPYFVLEYVPGGTLAARLAGPRQAWRWSADLVQTLARAVHFAHERQVIHRDLKPSNVLLTEDGAPKVADFGLAKLLDDDPGLTRGNAVVGTPSYMAPEQAEGKKDVGPAADVWALGAILYECLTGKPPFLGATPLETLEKVRTQDAVAVRALNPGVPRDLETIAHKCLEKEPKRRYVSAAALADDLRLYLEGEPIVARPRNWLTKVARLLWKRRLLAGTVIVCAVAITLAVWGTEVPADPDRARRENEQRLVNGDQAKWEGTEPRPWPFRQVYGARAELNKNANESHATGVTLGVVLWEFTDDPHSETYEFSAEVRHDDSGGDSEVGLYFNHRWNDPANQRRGAFHTLAFVDRGTLLEPQPGGGFQGAVTVRSRLFEIRTVPFVPFDSGIVGSPFNAARPIGSPGPWRKLILRVSPNGIQAAWEPTRNRREEVGAASGAELSRGLYRLAVSIQELLDVPTGYRPRGGLGLYAQNGQLSFRNVVLTPQPG